MKNRPGLFHQLVCLRLLAGWLVGCFFADSVTVRSLFYRLVVEKFQIIVLLAQRASLRPWRTYGERMWWSQRERTFTSEVKVRFISVDMGLDSAFWKQWVIDALSKNAGARADQCDECPRPRLSHDVFRVCASHVRSRIWMCPLYVGARYTNKIKSPLIGNYYSICYDITLCTALYVS